MEGGNPDSGGGDGAGVSHMSRAEGEIRAAAEHTSLAGLQDVSVTAGVMGVAAGATVTVALPICPADSENDSETPEELHTPTAKVLA